MLYISNSLDQSPRDNLDRSHNYVSTRTSMTHGKNRIHVIFHCAVFRAVYYYDCIFSQYNQYIQEAILAKSLLGVGEIWATRLPEFALRVNSRVSPTLTVSGREVLRAQGALSVIHGAECMALQWLVRCCFWEKLDQ